MGATFKTPSGCLTDSWNKIADNGKFQDRANSKSTVKELAGQGSYSDNYDTDPFADRLTSIVFDPEFNMAWYNNEMLWWPNGAGTSWGAAYYASLSGIKDVLLSAKVKVNNSNYLSMSALGLRIQADGKGYYFGLLGNQIKLVKKNTIGATPPVTLAHAGVAVDMDTWYQLKFKAENHIIKGKYWKDVDSEPTTGGPDNDGYQLKVIDTYGGPYTSGYVGITMGEYSGDQYLDNFLAQGYSYASDSPVLYCEWDSGQNGTVWADTFGFKHNVASTDDGVIKVRVGYSDTQPSALSEAACDALLGAFKTPDVNGDVTGVSGTGRWRVAAFQFDSDGAQQASLGIYDEAQDVTLTSKMMRVGAEVEGLVEQGSGTLNDTNVSDTITPMTRPCIAKVSFDISNLLAGDDFDLKVSIGAGGSEVLVNFYNITSDGINYFIDTGDGIVTTVKNKKIQAVSVLVETGSVLKIDYVKNSATSRDIDYGVLFGI